ncbi:hypothetical protein TREMEDRAFT_58971 [Tremella mesenterica DSM 1558]|uniref:uncharacterized protein n=1 Tax=Tremella mesenterica (strain ATCC 24925 / CBS 8224 / DSM 1558 / NBRC 9311 / NRRL Y-6157 / RJB 2259-6 / UBC 559-6) TaxID=578456 RepID=UPI0003F493AE|nr:uncharacterized protein TREMEDRAFT_58971 [Tremella mesenterica DSM 1558]EIW72801.1 hypothetical protein TREMEDRAFT_58971 [Tremella mesenterica DSM 1558]
MSHPKASRPPPVTSPSKNDFNPSKKKKTRHSKNREPYHEKLKRLFMESLDDSSILEPNIPSDLIHFFTLPDKKDPNLRLHGRSQQNIDLVLRQLACLQLGPPRQLNLSVPQGIPSSVKVNGLPYHLLRLPSLIQTSNREQILKAFHTFNDLKPFKHVSSSQRREGVEGLHPYHLGIVRRQGNSVGVTKDTSQTTREKINQPTPLQNTRRQAALSLLRLLEQFVCTPYKRQYSYVDKDTVDYSFFINHQGRDTTAAEGTIPDGEETRKIGKSKKGNESGTRFGGMAMAVAVGYGEARVPHLDQNDVDTIPTFFTQLSGDPGFTHFPQLHVQAALNSGDVLIAPTSNLIHHAVGEGPARQGRITAIFYTCRHVESLLGKEEDGKVVSGPLEGIATEDLMVFDEDETEETQINEQ